MSKFDSDRPCDGCEHGMALVGLRYCNRCRSRIIDRMEREGYLEPRVPGHYFRPFGSRENIYETKYGIDGMPDDEGDGDDSGL